MIGTTAGAYTCYESKLKVEYILQKYNNFRDQKYVVLYTINEKNELVLQ